MATPKELATCWMMFSIVEPRATWGPTSAFSELVISGIIVAPMPRPMTKSTGMTKPQ